MFNKPFFAFCCFVIFFPSITIAQKFFFGAKAGVSAIYTNFAEQPHRENFKSDIKVGYSFAGIIGFPMKNNYSFVAEGGLALLGRKYEDAPSGNTWNSTYYMSEFAMALRKTFRLKLRETWATNWFVNFGPNINYWIDGSGSMDPYFGIHQSYNYIFDKPSDQSYTNMYINNTNRWLFGLNLGLGFQATTLKHQRFLTEFRLIWGQTYLGQQNSEYVAGFPGITDQLSLKCNLKVLNFSVAYIFDKDIRESKMGKSNKKLK